jgi:hypothetical protein
MPVDRKTAEAMLYEFESALGRNSRDDIPAARAAVLDAMTLPDGRVLVPKVPTQEMMEAGYKAVGSHHYEPGCRERQGWGQQANYIYTAMLAAAQQKEDK